MNYDDYYKKKFIKDVGVQDYWDYGWLYEHYITRNMSQQEIADEVGAVKETIIRHLKRHGIKKSLLKIHEKVCRDSEVNSLKTTYKHELTNVDYKHRFLTTDLTPGLSNRDKYRQDKTYTYIIERSDKIIKIGKTNNPRMRLRNLENSGGFEIVRSYLATGGEFESLLHNYFKEKKYIGEWFKLSFEEAVKKLRELKSKARELK